MNIYPELVKICNERRKGLFVLLDPDKSGLNTLQKLATDAEFCGAVAILIGGSHIADADFDHAVQGVKASVNIPVILFPGSATQVSQFADAILFISLISGRNPQYLIGEQVRAALKIKKFGLEVIPTAYMLIESGKITAAEFISNTKPIPADQFEIAAAHALAAQMLGMKMVYLEAGSGALKPVSPKMIESVRRAVDVPLIVGGGIRNAEQAASAVKAGADFIVVGNALEKQQSELLKKMVNAIA